MVQDRSERAKRIMGWRLKEQALLISGLKIECVELLHVCIFGQ